MSSILTDHRQPVTAENAIGVLDLQGDVLEHLDHLQRLGIDARPVKRAGEFAGLAGLILPGGESTCLARLLKIFDLEPVIRERHRQGMKLWGTCAGAILLASTLTGEEPHLGLMDMEVERNGFGSQLDSFTCEAMIPRISADPLPLTFIRAPKIRRVGVGVDILLQIEDYIAAAESKDILATVFHPELTPCLAFHRYFAFKCGLRPQAGEALFDPSWKMTSWTRNARVA